MNVKNDNGPRIKIIIGQGQEKFQLASIGLTLGENKP